MRDVALGDWTVPLLLATVITLVPAGVFRAGQVKARDGQAYRSALEVFSVDWPVRVSIGRALAEQITR